MQIIIVYIILALTIAYAVYEIVKYIRKKNDPCGDCGGCEIKKEINKNVKYKVMKDPNSCGHTPKN